MAAANAPCLRLWGIRKQRRVEPLCSLQPLRGGEARGFLPRFKRSSKGRTKTQKYHEIRRCTMVLRSGSNGYLHLSIILLTRALSNLFTIDFYRFSHLASKRVKNTSVKKKTFHTRPVTRSGHKASVARHSASFTASVQKSTADVRSSVRSTGWGSVGKTSALQQI